MQYRHRIEEFLPRFPESHETVHAPARRQEIDFSACPLAHQKFGHSIERHAGKGEIRFHGTRKVRAATGRAVTDR